MGKVIIQEDTTKNPIQLIGKEAGVCWGADTTDSIKNYKRGIDCINSNHGRTIEFPQVYMILDGYSAKVIREFYTHIGGSPSRLQSSTRYINYGEFKYIVPPSIDRSNIAIDKYENVMNQISNAIKELETLGVPREDASMLLPLGMETKVVVRTNPRNLIDMSRQRECSRAYWEFRNLMKDIKNALSNYSDEWEELINLTFKSKCEEYGFCTERKSCGKKQRKEQV